MKIPKYVKCVSYYKKYDGKILNTELDNPIFIINTWEDILFGCGRLYDGSFELSTEKEYNLQEGIIIPNKKDNYKYLIPVINKLNKDYEERRICIT
jgi:hypothetical protein